MRRFLNVALLDQLISWVWDNKLKSLFFLRRAFVVVKLFNCLEITSSRRRRGEPTNPLWLSFVTLFVWTHFVSLSLSPSMSHYLASNLSICSLSLLSAIIHGTCHRHHTIPFDSKAAYCNKFNKRPSLDLLMKNTISLSQSASQPVGGVKWNERRHGWWWLSLPTYLTRSRWPECNCFVSQIVGGGEVNVLVIWETLSYLRLIS